MTENNSNPENSNESSSAPEIQNEGTTPSTEAVNTETVASSETTTSEQPQSAEKIVVEFTGSVSGKVEVDRGTTLEKAAKVAGIQTTGITFRSGDNVATLKMPINDNMVISSVTKTRMG